MDLVTDRREVADSSVKPSPRTPSLLDTNLNIPASQDFYYSLVNSDNSVLIPLTMRDTESEHVHVDRMCGAPADGKSQSPRASPSQSPRASCASRRWDTHTSVTLFHIACGIGEFISWILYLVYHQQENSQTNDDLYTDTVVVHIFILANLYVSVAVILLLERQFSRRRTLSALTSLLIVGIGVSSLRDITSAYLVSHSGSYQPLWLLVLPAFLCALEITGAIYLILTTLDDIKVKRYILWKSAGKESLMELIVVPHSMHHTS